MLNEIWKYEIGAIPGCFTVQIPKSADVLTVQMQGNIPVMWCRVNPRAHREVRAFFVVGTGIGFDAERLTYVQTWQDSRRSLVWHLFEDKL